MSESVAELCAVNEAAALHEAGHAVIGMLLGLEVIELSVRGKHVAFGKGSGKKRMLAAIAAGSAAQVFSYAPEKLSSGYDRGQIILALKRWKKKPADRDVAILTAGVSVVFEQRPMILEAVKAVADAAMRSLDGKLSGAEIERLVQRSLSDCYADAVKVTQTVCRAAWKKAIKKGGVRAA
jgi:hypothetical protein